jgi:hypothetical protein
MPTRKTSEPRHEPTLPPALALKRLGSLLDQVDELRQLTSKNTPEFKTWEQNVKFVLADYYGVPSPISSAFDRIRFTPGSSYPGQPFNEFVVARKNGLRQAEGFLRSRIKEIDESSAESTRLNDQVSQISAKTHEAGKSIFVVHGHDSGAKETVARFLNKIGLEPIILHEQADMGRTLIEKFEHHSSEASCAVVLLTPWSAGLELCQ